MRNLNAGSSYRFKFRGVNDFGIGDFSEVAVVVAATSPRQMSQATTRVVDSNV